MTEDEKYLFDLNGYLVIENVLTPDELTQANEAIDRHLKQGRYRPQEQSLTTDAPELQADQMEYVVTSMHDFYRRSGG